jgi:uncharacterized protein (DUF362 family)
MNKEASKTPIRRTGNGRSFASEPISRRSFIKRSAVLGASSILAGSAVGWMPKLAFAEAKADIAAVKGANYFQNTIKAVEFLGGMGKFVSKQSKVGLLINSPWQNPGCYVKPEITLAVVRMCLDAGAKEVGVIKQLDNSYWRRSAIPNRFQDERRSIRFIGDNFTEVPFPHGRSLKKAEIAKGMLECDVLINMPIAKHHDGVRFTGAVKNMMGGQSRNTHRFFHFSTGGRGYYDDVEFLSQCIADLNLLRKPDLCILDGTEMITENGPFGPGKLIQPQKVIAGTDRVAMDVYGANLLGLKGEEILTTKKAYEYGMGEIHLSSLQIQEVEP